MDYTDCKAYKDELGIVACGDSKDLYASTAYVCGGTKNMPTPDELVVLANDMYGTNIFNNGVDFEKSMDNFTRTLNSQKAVRHNKDYLEYFRTAVYSDSSNVKNKLEENYRKTTPIIILSNSLYEYDSRVLGRGFFSQASSLVTKYRYDSIELYKDPVFNIYGPYSICVDRSQSKPAKKYPLTKRNYTEETEDEIF